MESSMPQTKKVTKTEVREKFLGEHYPIHLVGRHMEITEAMKNYALEKLMKIEKFGGRVIEAWVVIDLQRGINMVDYLVFVNDKKFLATGRDKDMYAAIDQAGDRLKSIVSRYHKTLHDFDREEIRQFVHPEEKSIEPIEDINDQIDEATLAKLEAEFRPHPVTKKEKAVLKLLSEQEAIWKMESQNDNCLVYRGEEDEKIKVIYRLYDGSYGIIEAE